jgi:chromosome segregation ATPase
VKQALAKQAAPPAAVSREESRTSTPGQQGSQQNLQNQIRELSDSNTELREQLDEQKAKLKDLIDDMNRLRLELDQTKAGKPPARKNSIP